MNAQPQQSNSQQSPSRQQQQQAQAPQMFICQEKLDTDSPLAFKEPLPGAWDLHKEYMPIKTKEERERQSSRFKTELDPDDVKLVNELGHLSADKLMEYVRTLQNSSLSLGEEEAAQFTRAKLLNILKD